MSSLTKKQIVTLIKRHKLMPVLYDLDKSRNGKRTMELLINLTRNNSRPIRSVIGLLEFHKKCIYYRLNKNN
jgi:hypothetical protein